MFCNNCGHENPAESNFCSSCGAVLAQEQPGTDTTMTFAAIKDAEPEEEFAVPLEELEEGKALLLVRKGPEAGSKFSWDNEVVVAGREPDSDIFLGDVTVSRKHAEIRLEGSKFRIVDSGSLNGTFVNSKRVESAELSNGDEIQIGKFKLIFFTGDPGQ